MDKVDTVEDLKRFINIWYYRLSKKYQEAWVEWVRRRDVVVRAMGLNSLQTLMLTKRELANFVNWDIRDQIGLHKGTEDKIVKTHGNTEAVALCSSMADVYKEYTKRCQPYVKTFETKLDKIGKR